jgi:hypothetical protein
VSAYRAAAGEVPTIGVCCAACGALAQLGKETTFRCGRCGREQSAAPPPHVELLRATKHQERRGYDELAAFAGALGIRAPCTSIELSVDGLELEVSLDIDSGRVRGLDMSSRSTRLPEVRFRRENSGDREAKEKGVSRELQTGDPTFDDAVYIESDAADADLLVYLSSPHVRAAIVELLRSFEDLQVHADRIDATRNFGIPAAFHPDQIRRHLALLRLLAGTTRSLAPAPEKSGASWLMLLTLANLPAGWIAFGFIAHAYAPLDLSLVWISFAVGVAIALFSWPLFSRVLRGRSTSHTDLGVTRGASFASFPATVAALALLVNAGFDQAETRTRTLSVTGVDYDDEDHVSKTSARGDEVGPWSFHFRDPKKLVQVGQRVTVKTRPGTLGYEWPVSRAMIETRNGTLPED